MDPTPIVNGLGQFAVSSQTLIMLTIVMGAAALFFVSTFGRKLRARVAETMFTNWRLGLLGATGIALSLASGWTTWDGMRNFTQEPLLSLMITFGIQGVMLIVAWLIGESFATGMNVRPTHVSLTAGAAAPRRTNALRLLQPFIGSLIGVLLFASIAILILNQFGTDAQPGATPEAGGWSGVSQNLLFASIAILLVAGIFLLAVGDIAKGYGQALKIILSTAVLWIMFLACMVTSVFFSFDSLFSTIFPKQERERAAVLRAENQIAGVVNDVGAMAVQRRITEQDTLFQKPGWAAYEDALDKLVLVAREAPKELETYFERKMRERQKLVAQRQEEKASAQGQQVGLSQRKSTVVTEIARLKEQIGPLAAETERLKRALFEKDREVIAKRAEAEAEAGGIGETAKVGRGPKYRELANELYRLREQKKNLELQLSEFEKRLSAARRSIADYEAELSSIDGQIAQLRGRAQTAEQLIAMAKEAQSTDTPQFDPTNGLRQLERARIAFRQNPTRAGLAQIQGLCTTLISAMTDVPTLKTRARAIDCDPGQASEAAARVFALNEGIAALQKNCIGGEKLPQNVKADALFEFARRCVQDAGLPSADTDQLRTRINYLELNRDDKAHRFVVTSNAFQDGNKLAYLALAIAIAIDTLVFMSGLFGANAVRSPLSDVPTHKGRSAQQLEAVIDVALGPHPYETATHVLGALHPITPTDGFTAEILVHHDDPHAPQIRRVLNAGSSIGAVRHVDSANRAYQMRAELFEYLSIVAKREFEKDKTHGSIAELERTISVALLPDMGQNAETVLGYLHPIKESNGFMAELHLDAVNDDDRRVVRNALNAGAVYERVQRVPDNVNHFFIHSDFFKALVVIRGRLLMSAATGSHLIAPPSTEFGGSLTQSSRALPRQTKTQRLPGPETAAQDGSADAQDAASPVNGQSEDELRNLYWSRLIGGMGLNPATARDRLSSQGVVDASRDVWRELTGQGEGKTNPDLTRIVQAHAQAVERRLDIAYSRLRSEIDGEEHRLEILDAIEAYIQGHLVPLILFPESGLMEFMINGIERAAKSDDGLLPGEQALKDALINIRNDLGGMNLANPACWEDYARAIKDLPDASKVVQFKDGNDRRSMM